MDEEVAPELRHGGIGGVLRRLDRVGDGAHGIGGGHDQVNLGGRFSRNERTPSA